MGKSYLFLGTYTFDWPLAAFDAPIAFCKRYAIDGLLVKAYEKTQGLWYGGIGGFDAIYQRITGVGLECIGYGFHYGGADLAAEAQVGLSFMQKYGAYCMDSESAFDGQTAWGQELASIWANHPGKLWVSTWANPADHNWLGIISALSPHVQAWMPQVYSDKLADMALAQWPKTGNMQPTVGIIGDGDRNNGELHVKMFGDTDISIWEYQEAEQHIPFLQEIMHAFGGQPVVTPAPPPQVQPQGGSVIELKNFPFINQLKDGDVNSGLDCVPDSLASGASWLLGKPFDGAAMKDSVYGRNYIGGTAAANYVPYMKAHDILLFPMDSPDGNKLVQDVIDQLKAQHPVAATEPYSPKWTHVVCFYKYDEAAQTLSVMDPLGGHEVTRSVHEWSQLLLYNEVWGMEKIAVLTLSDILAKSGWKDVDSVLYAPTPYNTIPISGAWREYVLARSAPWHPDDYPLTPPIHLPSLEGSNPKIGPGQVMLFRFSGLEMRDGDTRVFEMSVGQELTWCRSKLTALKSANDLAIQQIQTDQVTIASLQQHIDALNQQLAQVTQVARPA